MLSIMDLCSESVIFSTYTGPPSQFLIQAPLHIKYLDYVIEFLITGAGTKAFVLSVKALQCAYSIFFY